MAITPRDEAIATLAEGQTALDALLARLSDEAMTRPATIGGGDWSAKDLLGHIAFWEELAGDALTNARAGRPPAAEGIFGGGPAAVDTANAENQARTTAQPLAEVRSRAAAAHSAIVDAIRAMSDEEWRSKVAGPGQRRASVVTLLGSILGAPKRPFGHAFAHLADLEAYVESLQTER